MSHLRKTTSYLVRVASMEPHTVADEMVARLAEKDLEVDTSGVHGGKAHVRFRCKTDDNLALNIALDIVGGRTFELLTGYGTHQREVDQ